MSTPQAALPFRILPLADRPDLVPLVAAWGYAEWGHLNPGETLASRRALIAREMNRDRVPSTYVAVDGQDNAVGTAALIFDDLEGDPRNPWLASVYVLPEARRQGIASALVRVVEAQARALGYERLYLFTETASTLYAALGWRTLETRDYRGEWITVMDRTF